MVESIGYGIPIIKPQYSENGPKNIIQISIACRNLVDLDLVTVSDPQVKVYLKNSLGQEYKLIGQTEVIENNLNPDFTTTFNIDFYFEKQQYLKFEVYDVDDKGLEHIGNCETTVSKIMGSRRQTFSSDLLLPGKTNKRGEIIVKADSVKSSNDEIGFFAEATLNSGFAGCFCGSDKPYLLIYRSRGEDISATAEFVRVHQTENQPDTLTPNFTRQKLQLRLEQLCNSDKDLKLKFEVRNYVRNGAHNIYGSAEVTVNQMVSSPDKNIALQLTNELSQQAGVLNLNGIQLIERTGFVDYLKSGWNINMSVAIDFTASNKEVTDPNSLHRMYSDGQQNDYEKAITQVGQILEPYAFNRYFAAFGFGGIPLFAGGTSVSHCFNLSGSVNPTIEGLPNLYNAYKNALRGTTLFGPTNFSYVLRAVLDYMKVNLTFPLYHILLIITDGVIHDMSATQDLIVECSRYPLSIIIVGVGEEDFANMIELDGDRKILRNSKGEAAVRDIVQFVKFKDFKDKNQEALLAEEVLREIPDQLVSYMRQNKILPSVVPFDLERNN